MTPEELRDMLSNLRGTTFVTFQALTDPRLLANHPITGQPNPFRDAMKVSKVNGTIGFIYENSVNRQREREELTADFVAMPRRWGRRINGTPLVEHNGEHYLEVKVEKSYFHGYIRQHPITGQWEMLPTEAVDEYLPPRRPTRQGVRKEVILRDYTISNIRELQLRGEHIEVTAA
jgi:hypothetical protein